MTGFNKILCPVEFEGNCAAALHLASRLVVAGGVLYLLHVVPEVERPGFEHYPPTMELAHECLETFADEHLPGEFPRELLVRLGDPAEIITATADQFGVDLVVMATHGHRGIARVILGSVAEQVLRRARQPVLTLRSAATPQPWSA
jgi:universal stress protein A